MRVFRVVAVLALVGITSGCYKATVDTGRPPSGQTIRQEWAHSFLYGLVPPSTVETAQRCPSGVAQVETQLSFLNQVAAWLTGGLYTPMTITVQCAAGASADAGAVVDGRGRAAEAMAEAMDRAAESGEAVYVQF